MKKKRKKLRGFTLVEVLTAASILGLVVAGAWSILIFVNRMWNMGAAQVRSAQMVDRAMNIFAYGGPGAAWTGAREIDFGTATLSTTTNGWVFNAGTNQLSYSKATKRIVDRNGVVICRDMASSSVSLTNGGLSLTISVVQTSAVYKATNTATTYVRMRN